MSGFEQALSGFVQAPTVIMAKRNPGPFLESFFIPQERIDRVAQERLLSLGLMPSSPGPVPIERYCDKRWGFTEDYVDLPAGILGNAVFSEEGIVSIRILRELGDDSSQLGVIRTRSTIAHEIGHGELHEEKYVAKLIHDRTQGDFFKHLAADNGRIATACREEQIFGSNKDEWWEAQANKFMAALLMPKQLLRQVFDEWNRTNSPEDWPPVWPLAFEIADTFKVSQKMADIAAKTLRERESRESGQMQTTALKQT